MTRIAEADTLPMADTAEFCCPPILGETISEEDAIIAAGIFKALAEPARVHLLSTIAAGGAEGVCVCELVAPLDLSQPTVSHHLRVLHDAGLVHRERRGTWAYYSLRADAIAMLAQALHC